MLLWYGGSRRRQQQGKWVGIVRHCGHFCPFETSLSIRTPKCTPTVTVQPHTAGWRHTDVLRDHVYGRARNWAVWVLKWRSTAHQVQLNCSYIQCTIVHQTDKVQLTLTAGQSVTAVCSTDTYCWTKSVTAVCSTDTYCWTKSVTAVCSTDTYCWTVCYCSVFNWHLVLDSLLLQCVKLTLTAGQSVTAVFQLTRSAGQSVTAVCSTDTYCWTVCYCSVFNWHLVLDSLLLQCFQLTLSAGQSVTAVC